MRALLAGAALTLRYLNRLMLRSQGLSSANQEVAQSGSQIERSRASASRHGEPVLRRLVWKAVIVRCPWTTGMLPAGL